jgi:hypothetical protein
MNKLLKTITSNIDPHINGGESVTIKTLIYDNGDSEHGLPTNVL